MPELVIRNGDVKVRVQQPSITTELAVLQGPAGRPGDKGEAGATGPANSLAIGTVTSGDVPSATITGAAPAQTLNLVLAKGEKGDQGPKGEPGSGSVNSVNGDLGPDIVLDAADVGASPVGHTHTASEVGASPVGHTHTPAEAGAAPAVHTHTKSQVTDFAHTHVKADVTDFAHSHPIGDLPVATSGTSNSTQVVRADDSRLSNARTPTAHKSTHATGGSDALVPTDIDAANRKKGGDEAVAAGSATTGTVTLDCSAASIFTITPTGDITLAPSNVPASGRGCTITVIISQGATVRALTMPGGSVWLGSAPTQAANKKCVVTMLTTDGGTNWVSSGVVQA